MSERNKSNKGKNQNAKKEKKSSGRQPDYRVVTPKAKSDDSDEVFWTRIGSAWETDKGGISVSLNALPLGDRIMLFPNDEESESGEE